MNFCLWLYWNVSFRQLPVQPVMKISSNAISILAYEKNRIIFNGRFSKCTFYSRQKCNCSSSRMSPLSRPHFYQTRSAWSMDQGSNKNHSPVNNCAPTVTKFCVMWEGQALPHDTKFSNCRNKIVDSRAFPSWSLIHGSSWSGLIKVGPGSF